jgi:drug/metabolite transporter (DMT)-like permease
MSAEPRRVANAAALAIITGAVMIGSSPILIRLSELSPNATAIHRVALAVPVLMLAMALMPPAAESRPLERPPAWTRSAMGLGGALFALDLVCFHWSLSYTTVANSVLLLNLAPAFASLAAWGLFGERLSLPFLASLAVALLGVALLAGSHAELAARGLFGDALALAAGASYGGYLLAVSRLRRHHGTLAIMTWTSFACTLCLVPVVLAAGDDLVPATLGGVGVLLALAWLTHAAGQGLVAYALKALPAASSTTLLLQPLVAAIGAWILLGETLGPIQIAGAALVIVGVGLCRRLSPPLNPAGSDRVAKAAP